MKTISLKVKAYEFDELMENTKESTVARLQEEALSGSTLISRVLYADFQNKAYGAIKEYEDFLNGVINTNGVAKYRYSGFHRQGDGGSFIVTQPFTLKFTYDKKENAFCFGETQVRDDLAYLKNNTLSFFGGVVLHNQEEMNRLFNVGLTVKDIEDFLNLVEFRVCDNFTRKNSNFCTICDKPKLDPYVSTQMLKEANVSRADVWACEKMLLEDVKALVEFTIQDLGNALYENLLDLHDDPQSKSNITSVLEDEPWYYYASNPESFLGFTGTGGPIICPDEFEIVAVD